MATHYHVWTVRDRDAESPEDATALFRKAHPHANRKVALAFGKRRYGALFGMVRICKSESDKCAKHRCNANCPDANMRRERKIAGGVPIG